MLQRVQHVRPADAGLFCMCCLCDIGAEELVMDHPCPGAFAAGTAFYGGVWCAHGNRWCGQVGWGRVGRQHRVWSLGCQKVWVSRATPLNPNPSSLKHEVCECGCAAAHVLDSDVSMQPSQTHRRASSLARAKPPRQGREAGVARTRTQHEEKRW